MKKKSWLALFSLILLSAGLVVVSLLVQQRQELRKKAAPSTDSPYGVNVDLWWWNFFPRIDSNQDGQVSLRDNFDSVKISQMFQDLASAGAKYHRFTFYWNKIQYTNANDWNWSDHDFILQLQVNNGLEPVPYLIYTPDWASRCQDPSYEVNRRCPPRDWSHWEEFVRQSVRRYGSQGRNWVKYWEIWNEPDLMDFWLGSVADYYQLLKRAYQVIQAEDPSAQVLIGGLSDIYGHRFAEQLFTDYPDVKNYFDIYNFHAYGDQLFKFQRHQQILNNYSLNNREVWATEINNRSWRSQEEGANGIKSLHQSLFQNGVDKVFWFSISDDVCSSTNPICWGPGLFTDNPKDITDDYNKLPFYYAYQEMTGGSAPPPSFATVINNYSRYYPQADLINDQVINSLDIIRLFMQ